ncbi:unnamed protein product [Cochlearia groenlandica]
MMNMWRTSTLNPYAPKFRPVHSDTYCLFLTFSNGFPLTESQIFHFFNMMFFPYVEYVYVHKPRATGREAAKPPLFGKVMFKCSRIPDSLMGSRDRICLSVDGYPLYCKRFVSQVTKAPTHHGNGHA